MPELSEKQKKDIVKTMLIDVIRLAAHDEKARDNLLEGLIDELDKRGFSTVLYSLARIARKKRSAIDEAWEAKFPGQVSPASAHWNGVANMMINAAAHLENVGN